MIAPLSTLKGIPFEILRGAEWISNGIALMATSPAFRSISDLFGPPISKHNTEPHYEHDTLHVLQTLDTSSQAELSHAELLNRTEVPE